RADSITAANEADLTAEQSARRLPQRRRSHQMEGAVAGKRALLDDDGAAQVPGRPRRHATRHGLVLEWRRRVPDYVTELPWTQRSTASGRREEHPGSGEDVHRHRDRSVAVIEDDALRPVLELDAKDPRTGDLGRPRDAGDP